jgi:hypothetical protein
MLVSYTPLTAFASVLASLALCLGLGTVARDQPPEIRILAGWGALCVPLTLWGVAVDTPMTPVLLIIGFAGLLGLAWWGLRADTRALGIALALTLPFWIMLLPAKPSQVDTWLNLLPNAAYLVDHGLFPRHDRPPSWSFLPVAPYNTQFLVQLASGIAGRLIANGLALFNLALLTLGGILLARALSPRPGWWAIAAGLTLAVPLNPGFVPRVSLSGYGETPLAVAAVFAVWLGADALRQLREKTWPAALTPAALILVAMVNTKQSAFGLVAAIGAAFAVLALRAPGVTRSRAILTTLGLVAPATIMFLVWRGYATTAFPTGGELRPLPFTAWNFALLPTILAAMLRVIIQKATLYLCLFAVIGAAIHHWRHHPWAPETIPLGLISLTSLFYLGFLTLTYVVHFPPDMARNAHSFARYGGHLSLLIMLGLALWLRPVLRDQITTWSVSTRRRGMLALIAFVPALPVALGPMLRFDVQAPQPQAFRLGPQIARHLPRDASLTVIVPGDPFDAAGSFFRGILLYLEPRHPGLRPRTINHVDPTILAEISTDFAFISCAPSDLNLPRGTGEAVLLRREASGWTVLETWPWSPGLATERFGSLLEPKVFCVGSTRG